MKSIENASKYIDTPYVFHCEEDWEFYDYGFIEKSFEVLNKDPNVCTVFLRNHDENKIRSGINIDPIDQGGYYYIKPKYVPNPPRVAGVLTFNPGLRRRSISLAKIPYDNEDEGTLGYYFWKKGMYGATLLNANGYVKHIGWEKHVH
jgi:hypothetical protein